MRNTAAILWLSSAFFVTPLAFCRLTGEKVPLFGLVSAVTLPVLAVTALALTLVCMDFRVYKRDFRWRLLGCAQAAVAAVSLWHCCNGVPWESFLLTMFWVLAPTVGVALKDELEKMLGIFALLWTVLLIFSGINSEHFTGFIGNWNWTQAMLAAMLPGCFLLFKIKKWQYWSLVALAIVFVFIYLKYPEQLSRSMLVAIPVTLAVLLIQEKWRLLPWLRKFHPAWAVGVAALGLILFIEFADFNSSRLQLWKGTIDLLLSHGIGGVGMGQYAGEILPFLPEKYYFTPFAAPWHPHPHNELLNFVCAYGIAGLLYIWALIYMVLSLPPRNDRETFARWVFLILLTGGMFDMSCAVLPGALWCFCCAGISGGRYRPARIINIPGVIPGVLLLALAAIMIRANVASTTARRNGELALSRRDVHTARKFLQQSSEVEAQYLLAELELMVFKSPERAERVLAGMKNDYLHTSRLRALVHYLAKDYEKALTEMKRECRNYPYSVINAHWYYRMLQASQAPLPDIREAEQIFAGVCALRGITPAQAGSFTSKADDSPLKYPAD